MTVRKPPKILAHFCSLHRISRSPCQCMSPVGRTAAVKSNFSTSFKIVANLGQAIHLGEEAVEAAGGVVEQVGMLSTFWQL